jgi:uncharacterized protein (DUF427 family)
MKRSAKIKANNKRRNNRRVWNGVVAKLSTEGTIQLEEKPPVFYEEDADDRFERHMNSMHKAMERNDRAEYGETKC